MVADGASVAPDVTIAPDVAEDRHGTTGQPASRATLGAAEDLNFAGVAKR